MKTGILLAQAIIIVVAVTISMFVSYEAHAQQQPTTLTTTEKLWQMPCIGGDESGNTNELTYHMLQGVPEDYRIVSGYITRGSVEMFFAGYKDCPQVTHEKAFDDGGIFYAEHRLYPPFSKKLHYEKQLQELEQRYEHAVTASEYNGHPMIILDQQKIQQWTATKEMLDTESLPNYSQLRYVNTDKEHMITIRASSDPSKLIRMLDMTLNPSGPIVDHTRILKLDEFAYDIWHDNQIIMEATVTDIRDNNSEEYPYAYNLHVDRQFKPLGTSMIASNTILVHGRPSFEIEKGEPGLFFIKRDNARFVFGDHGAKTTSECTAEMSYHKSRLLHPSREMAHESEFIAEDAVKCYPAYYRSYLPEFIEAHEKTIPNPRMQVDDGVLSYHVVCKEGLNLLLKPSEFDVPVCVGKSTYDELVTRGWMIAFSWS